MQQENRSKHRSLQDKSQGDHEEPLDSYHGFKWVYETHYGLVYHFFRQRVYDTEEAKDLTQETFFRVLNGLQGFRGEADIRNWIMKIASNLFINELQRKMPAHTNDRKNLDLDNLKGKMRDTDLVDGLVQKEQRQKLKNAMDTLPPRMRYCIALRVAQHLKYTEIATIMQLKPNTIKSMLSQARERLKLLLREEKAAADE